MWGWERGVVSGSSNLTSSAQIPYISSWYVNDTKQPQYVSTNIKMIWNFQCLSLWRKIHNYFLEVFFFKGQLACFLSQLLQSLSDTSECFYTKPFSKCSLRWEEGSLSWLLSQKKRCCLVFSLKCSVCMFFCDSNC